MGRARAEESMAAARITGSNPTCWFRSLYVCVVLLTVCLWLPWTTKAQASASPSTATPSTAAPAPATKTSSADVLRGKRLILKDGTYQVVREYQRNGDRVRYWSEERGDWEELPASMVDWDATAKYAVDTAKSSAALVEKVHEQEEAKRMDNVSDIDASLQVGEGAFLPQGDGLFVVEGKSVRFVKQAVAGNKRDRMRTVEQVLSPIPIVPGKQRIYLAGEHATLRLKTITPEFYLREPPPDPDRVSPIETSSRPGESGPDVVLIRAKQMHGGRELASIKTLFGEKIGENADEVAIQRWEVAPNVYRFTLGEQLTAGEYVLAEVLPDGLNYFVWDFGVDAPGAAGDTKVKK
jgi:hypothetical protein